MKGKKGVPPEDPKDKDKPVEEVEATTQPVVEASDPDLSAAVPADAFHREYRKHRATGEIMAVELFHGQLHAARLCTRPEEQADGALPVMQLHTAGEALDYYRANAKEFDAWSPPRTQQRIIRELLEQEGVVEQYDRELKMLKDDTSDVKKRRDVAVKKLQALIRALGTGQQQPNLLDNVAPEPDPDEDEDEDEEDAGAERQRVGVVSRAVRGG